MTTSSPAKAGGRELVILCFEGAKSLAVNLFVDNLGNRKVKGWKEGRPDETFQVKLRNRLGFGGTAAVYRGTVEGLPEVDAALGKGAPVAVKFTHQIRFNKSFPLGHDFLLTEHEFLEAAQAQVGAFEANPNYPKDPAWGKGRLPTLPMFGPFPSAKGYMLIKPIAKGKSLSEIYREHKPKSYEDLPKEMRDSLDEIYQFAMVAKQSGKFPLRADSRHESRPLNLDINPTNLFWVEDPQAMKELGLTRPSFMTYELGVVIESFFDQIPKSTDYQRMVVGFMQAHGALGR